MANISYKIEYFNYISDSKQIYKVELKSNVFEKLKILIKNHENQHPEDKMILIYSSDEEIEDKSFFAFAYSKRGSFIRAKKSEDYLI